MKIWIKVSHVHEHFNIGALQCCAGWTFTNTSTGSPTPSENRFALFSPRSGCHTDTHISSLVSVSVSGFLPKATILTPLIACRDVLGNETSIGLLLPISLAEFN